MKVDSTKTGIDEVSNHENNELVVVLDEDESLSEVIPSIVESISGIGVTELQPLYETINTDALDALFHSRDDGAPRDGEGSVVFCYESYQVKVQGNSRIRLSNKSES